MRVCLVGAGHPCHNPRLVREADTLAELGHEVRVVTPSFNPALVEKDRRLMTRRRWQLKQVRFPRSGSPLSRYALVRGRQRVAGALYAGLRWDPLLEQSYTPALPELVAVAAARPTDWYIAHAHPALPVAAAAARLRDARLGFDCEDLLAEHFTGPVNPPSAIERRYLRRCAYVSTPSEEIARRVRERHDIETTRVLYNVFPLHLAAGLQEPGRRPSHDALRLHWFGQTIGPGRGMEEVIAAVGRLDGAVELHLRGAVDPGYEATLRGLIEAPDLRDRVTIHPQVAHDALIGTMGDYDVGLAVEQPDNRNSALTVSNKLFSYLLAGLAVAVTDTPGQAEVFRRFSAAGFMYPAGDAGALAHGLRTWIDGRAALRAAQESAWRAARERWCWDVEQDRFLACLSLPAATGVRPELPVP